MKSSSDITYAATASTPSQTAGTIDVMFTLLYKQPFFTEMLALFFKDHNDRQEFKQYVSEKLLLQDQVKVLTMYNNGQIRFWLSRVFSNNVKSSSGDWSRIYRNPKMDLTDFQSPDHQNPNTVESSIKLSEEDFKEQQNQYQNPTSDPDNIRLAIEQALIDLIKQRPRLQPYIRIFKMHFYEGKSISKIQRETKVDYKMISKQVGIIQILVKNYLKQRNITPYDND